MARIDSILSIADRQGANELRLGSDREPQMFADGTQKRLAMPKTPTETLRELLGELLPPDREKMLAAQGQVQFLYEAGALGPYRVALTRRGPPGAPLEIDAVFQRGRGKAGPAGPAPPPPLHAAPAAAPRGVSVEPVARAQEPVKIPASLPSAPGAPSAPSAAGAAGAAGVPGAASVEAPSPELAALLGRALASHASDLHLMDGEPPLVRVGGKLRALGAEPIPDVAGLLGPGLADLVRRRLATGSSLDVALGAEGMGRFRLNAYATATGLATAIRVLQGTPPALSELGLPVPLDDLIDLPHGLVLVAGATGSGKTTTLAALAQEALRRRPGMLITLEDPIEYVLSARGARGACRQRQIGRDVKDFATGLRDALREDPDVLLIGEMRDPETITLALTAAETGHLVLASLHSRGAASAIERIVDSYPAERHHQIRVQVADALRVVVAQRLVPRANAHGAGGDGSARESRVLAAEILRVNHAAASAIRDAKTAGVQSAIQAGRREGMLPLERCLADLVQRQRVSLDDARAAANDPSVLASYLSGSPG